MVAVLGFAGILRAEPLDLKQVDADAKWAVHVDLDAARASTVLQNAYQLPVGETPGNRTERLAEAPRKVAIRSRADLHGVTFYGQQFKKRRRRGDRPRQGE